MFPVRKECQDQAKCRFSRICVVVGQRYVWYVVEDFIAHAVERHCSSMRKRVGDRKRAPQSGLAGAQRPRRWKWVWLGRCSCPKCCLASSRVSNCNWAMCAAKTHRRSKESMTSHNLSSFRVYLPTAHQPFLSLIIKVEHNQIYS